MIAFYIHYRRCSLSQKKNDRCYIQTRHNLRHGEWVLRINGWLARSNFWSHLLLKLKEISDANQHFYEMKQ